MDAIVCDRCGKVHLLEDGYRPVYPENMTKLTGSVGGKEVYLDLCADCAENIIGLTRNGEA